MAELTRPSVRRWLDARLTTALGTLRALVDTVAYALDPRVECAPGPADHRRRRALPRLVRPLLYEQPSPAMRRARKGPAPAKTNEPAPSPICSSRWVLREARNGEHHGHEITPGSHAR